ncbi:hypothetical protein GGR58DRAFT_496113 [Xylaria digitata]|nr:hypothetical protein GGR58DRAFT_496113 [Xylaria digitata]
MRFSSLLLLIPLAAANAGDIVVDFDPALEGRVGVHYEVEEAIGRVHVKPQFKHKKTLGVVAVRSLLDGRSDLDALLGKRACEAGYGACPDGSGCCPGGSSCCPDVCCEDGYLCCSYGGCVKEGDKCCPGGACDADEGCCGQNHCYPLSGDCCSDESSCNPGNNCYVYPDDPVDPFCCTDSSCTAFVDEYGITSYASTTTTTRTYTFTSTRYYYWTVTWWYWYYYWTYSIAFDASIVTSSRSTTSSVFSVRTTDADAASTYFSELSETLVLPTPSAATSLASLAGSTSASQSATDGAPSSSSSSNTGPGSSNEPGSSTARSLWSHLDGFTVGFLTFGVGVGLTAVLL